MFRFILAFLLILAAAFQAQALVAKPIVPPVFAEVRG
jgi:hypothetical protein